MTEFGGIKIQNCMTWCSTPSSWLARVLSKENFNPFSRKKIVVANEFTVMKSFGANNCWNQPKSSWLVTENSELQKNKSFLFFSYCPLIQRK